MGSTRSLRQRMGGTKSINRTIKANKFFLRSFLFFCTCACKRKEMNQRKENQRISKELVKYLFKNFRSQEPVNFFQILTSSNRGYDRGTPPVPPILKTLFFTFYIINIINIHYSEAVQKTN